MKAEILEPIPSTPSAEVNYKVPVPSPSRSTRPWRMSIFLSLGVLVLLASFVIAAISLRSHASPSSSPSSSAAAPTDDKRWYSLGFVDIDGGVTPLYPVQMGRIASIKAKENESVKAGAELFRLEDTVPQQKVLQAKAGVDEAQGQLKVAQAEADTLDKRIAAQREAIEAAEIEVNRARNLRDEKKKFRDDGVGGKTEADDAQFLVEKAQKAVRGAQAQLAALEVLKGKTTGGIAMAHANLKLKQGLLAEAENAVKECVVRAPVDGTPLRILITVGETLGANPRQPAIQFAAAKPKLVRAEVEQEFVGHVRPNQNVSIEDNITGEEVARGKVANLALWYAPRRTLGTEVVPLTSDNRTLEGIIQIESIKRTIRIGQRVRVVSTD